MGMVMMLLLLYEMVPTGREVRLWGYHTSLPRILRCAFGSPGSMGLSPATNVESLLHHPRRRSKLEGVPKLKWAQLLVAIIYPTNHIYHEVAIPSLQRLS
jgi:hypothetical protein